MSKKKSNTKTSGNGSPAESERSPEELAEALERQRELSATFDSQTYAEIPDNRSDALYSIESVIFSQIAILQRRKNMPDGLERKEWNRLNDLVRMMKGLTDIELTSTKKSLLEGLSDEEVLKLVEEAKRTILEE